MTLTLTDDTVELEDPKPSRGARQFGYVVGVGVGAAMLYVANHVLEWGWFSWLTADFDRVLPILNVSIWAGIVANTLYLLYDPDWFKDLTQIPQLIISGLVGFRTLDVFPFDFSAYEFAWDTLVRWCIILPLIGIGIALLAVTLRLLSGPVRAVMSSSSRPEIG